MLLRPNQATRDSSALEQHRFDTVSGEAVSERAAGQSGPHDQDPAHALNASVHPRRPCGLRSATMGL